MGPGVPGRGVRGGLVVSGVVHGQRPEQRLAGLDAAMKDVHAAEEVHHERCGWMIEQLFRAAVLLDPSGVHDDDAIGELERLFLIVRDEDARHVNLLVQPPEPPAKLLPDLGIERAEGLVEQQDLRFDRQRSRQRDALPLTARQLTRIPVAEVIELNQLEQMPHAIMNGLSGRPAIARLHAQAKRDVFEDRHVPEERVMLKDEPDPPVPGGTCRSRPRFRASRCPCRAARVPR